MSLITTPSSSKHQSTLDSLRQDFPILHTQSRGKPLVYLDNGATTQKPQVVMDALSKYYEHQNANIHRGVYELSQIATDAYEQARRKIQKFVNASESAEIIFTRGTTESINLIASSFGNAFVNAGDEIMISAMEHHSNIVPWQMLCLRTGAVLRVIPMTDAGELILDEFRKLLSDKTKLVSIVHISNSLGTVNPVETIIQEAHAAGAKVLLDGAQWVAHASTDVQKLDVDFYVFSGHKLFGPTGIGILYGKRALLDAMPPYQGGGDMIEQVTFAKTTYAALPNKFEAGTPHIAGAIGLGVAVDYIQSVGWDFIQQHEQTVHAYLNQRIAELPGVRIIGTAKHKAGVVSFVVDEPKISAHDVGIMLDLEGIACRTGHHCCQPVMDRFGIPGTIRASVAMYNSTDDVDRLIAAMQKILTSHKPKHAVAAESTTIKFPAPSASSPGIAATDLLDTFAMFDDWKDRYQILIEMGEKLLPMQPSMKNEATRVHGCQSTVYLFAVKKQGTKDTLDFLADSDADLVRGLIALLQKLFAGQSSNDILAFDVEGFFQKMGLDQHLTMGRRNGLAGMIERIKAHARQLAQ